MSTKQLKQRVVSFKADEDLVNFLDSMPNKSDFIRKAVLASLLEPCPVCQGTGSVPRSLRTDLEKIFKQQQLVPCSFCGYEFPLKIEQSKDGPDDKERLQQYLGGGEFYCCDCFAKTQTCEDCGEHVIETRMKKHRSTHNKSDAQKRKGARIGRGDTVVS